MATMVIPERSLAQRFAALERANEIRSYRAGVKRDVAARRKRVVDLLDDPMLDTMRVFELLLAQPKQGRVKVNRLLSRLHISPSKTVGGLSPRQVAELRDYLR